MIAFNIKAQNRQLSMSQRQYYEDNFLLFLYYNLEPSTPKLGKVKAAALVLELPFLSRFQVITHRLIKSIILVCYRVDTEARV